MSIWYDRDRFLFTIQLCQLTAVDDITDYLGLSSVSWQQLMTSQTIWVTSQTIWVSALSVDSSWWHHRLFGSQLCQLTTVDDITDYLGLSSVGWQQLTTSQTIWVSALSVDSSWHHRLFGSQLCQLTAVDRSWRHHRLFGSHLKRLSAGITVTSGSNDHYCHERSNPGWWTDAVKTDTAVYTVVWNSLNALSTVSILT